MAQNGYEKLKIKTVSGSEDESFTFSPEEMQPIEVADAFDSDLAYGLRSKQAKKRLHRTGPNDLKKELRLSFGDSLRKQVKGVTGVFLPVVSLIMYLFCPDESVYLISAIAAALLLPINAFAEYRASRALILPRKYSSLRVRCTRDGKESVIDSRTLVPGDIIYIEQGGMVPADCRLISDVGLTVLETPVSGVEDSVLKDSRYLASDGNEAVCINMIYAGSIVTSGHCTAIVCRTGADTLIRSMHDGGDEYTPGLLKYVKRFASAVSILSVSACLVLLAVGIFAGADITELFVCALAIGEASLCDSMLSLCSTSLAFGVRRMAQDGLVVRNLGCIHTLAGVDTMMCGRNLAFPPKRISLTGLFLSGRVYDREKRPSADVLELLRLMLVCSDAESVTKEEKRKKHGLPEYRGTPIENAVVDYFDEWNEPIGNIREQYIRMDAEYTASGEVARVLALYKGHNTVILKGAPENVLSRCVGYTLDGSDYKLSDFTRKKILSSMQELARVNGFLIGVACGETEADNLRDLDSEQQLIFKGFISFSGSLDPGVAASVYRCTGAGIETVLLSDDAYYPAYHSAKSAGIINDESQIITAPQLRTCDRGLFIANCPHYKVFLGINEEEWLDIAMLKRNGGRTVAVTAERIGDLPVMKEADVSAVPVDSCDTLRRTADLIMLGSGINHIADGILNAKTVCKRIRAVTNYLLVGSIMMFIATVFSMCYDRSMALRLQEILIGGIVLNLLFAAALAFSPRSVRTIKERFSEDFKNPALTDFIYPLMFSIGAGILLFFCYAATRSYFCALLALTVLLFVFACTAGSHGGVFAIRRLGNRLLWTSGVLAALVLALCTLTSLGKSVFGYTVPGAGAVVFTLIACIAYCVITEVFRYIFYKDRMRNPAERSKK